VGVANRTHACIILTPTRATLSAHRNYLVSLSHQHYAIFINHEVPHYVRL